MDKTILDVLRDSYDTIRKKDSIKRLGDAITLLDKGYGLHDIFEDITRGHNDIINVPNKRDTNISLRRNDVPWEYTMEEGEEFYEG